MSGPLTALKVIEFAGLGPAPLAGQLLADQGADVVLIDRASGEADVTDVNRRGKRSVVLNLKSDAGLAAAKRLIAGADVVIEGFRPGVMEKLGLGPDVCEALNPRLVYARMTGWGQSGPLAHSAGHDINYLSLTGALHAIGTKDQPIPPLNLAADYGGGTMFLIFGILSALFERQSSGRGQVVDAAMVDGANAMMGLFHSMIAQGTWAGEKRQSNWLDGGAPFYRCYVCVDGKHISLGPLEPQFFAEMVRLAGLNESECAIQNDVAEWPAMHQRFEAKFAKKSRDEWAAIFEGTDACVAPVLTFEEAAAHPHMAERAGFVRPNGVLQAGPAPRFERTPAAPVATPRGAGEDGAEILAEAGLSTEEIAALI